MEGRLRYLVWFLILCIIFFSFPFFFFVFFRRHLCNRASSCICAHDPAGAQGPKRLLSRRARARLIPPGYVLYGFLSHLDRDPHPNARTYRLICVGLRKKNFSNKKMYRYSTHLRFCGTLRRKKGYRSVAGTFGAAAVCAKLSQTGRCMDRAVPNYVRSAVVNKKKKFDGLRPLCLWHGIDLSPSISVKSILGTKLNRL